MAKQKIVVTNLRIPESDWRQVKAAAAALGMSANEYVKQILRSGLVGRQLGVSRKKTRKTGYAALREFMNQKYESKPMGASEEDKVIYGIDD